MKIGRTTATGIPAYFNGSIDEVRVYDRSLTISEILSAKNNFLRNPNVISVMPTFRFESFSICRNFDPISKFSILTILTLSVGIIFF